MEGRAHHTSVGQSRQKHNGRCGNGSRTSGIAGWRRKKRWQCIASGGMLFGNDGGTDFRFGNGCERCTRSKRAHLFFPELSSYCVFSVPDRQTAKATQTKKGDKDTGKQTREQPHSPVNTRAPESLRAMSDVSSCKRNSSVWRQRLNPNLPGDTSEITRIKQTEF